MKKKYDSDIKNNVNKLLDRIIIVLIVLIVISGVFLLIRKEEYNKTVIEVNDDKAVSLILGKWQNKNADYSMMKKTVNIYRFEKNFLQYKLLPQISTFLTTYDKNNYYEVALGGLIYYRMSDIILRIFDVYK